MTKKIVLETNGIVDDKLGLKMVGQLLEKDPGTYKFTGGFTMQVIETKTQRTYKVVGA